MLVSALLTKQADSSSRQLLRACARGDYRPLLSLALFKEYEDVLSRPSLVAPERRAFVERALDGFVSLCDEVRIFFRFRPDLPDEADNHVLELALAGSAHYIVTYNAKDFRGELIFEKSEVLSPEALLERNV